MAVYGPLDDATQDLLKKHTELPDKPYDPTTQTQNLEKVNSQHDLHTG